MIQHRGRTSVLEVDDSTSSIGNSSIVENLEENLNKLPRSLFKLIDEHNRVRFPPDELREQPSFIVADVTCWSSEEFGDSVFLRVFRGVDSKHGIGRVEEEFGERFRELSFTSTGGTDEEETGDWSIGIGKSGTIETDSVRNSSYCFVLTDDLLAKSLFHLEKFLLLGQLGKVSKDAIRQYQSCEGR